ncbi:MAG: VWA domain-containing protein [Acidobacteriota bacterium]
MKYQKFLVIAGVLFVAVLFSSLSITSANFNPQSEKKNQENKNQKADDKNKKSDDEDDGQIIKLGTQLVTVPFTVTEKSNRYVNDLKKEDLEILEDGKPQQVESFDRQTDAALTIAMLIDISGSQEFTLPIQISAGKKFFERILRPKKDLAAVVTFQHESELVQDLTSNMQKLERALDDVRIPVAPSAIPSGRGTPPINGGSHIGATAMYDAIYSTSGELLSGEAGRRVIILLTDGQDTDSHIKMREAIEKAWRHEVIIYTIGISGSTGIASGDLKKIASETGGRSFVPRSEKDLDEAYAQIDEDLRSHNILTYQSSNEAQDGSFRTIVVRVKNRKDLTVRHRRGYFAKKEGA